MKNSTHSNPGIEVCLCASVVDQACESDLKESGSALALVQCMPENESISQSICKEKECRPSALSGSDRLDGLIPFY